MVIVNIWMDPPRTSPEGYASEAVRAVTAAAFDAGIRRMILNCHPDNVASIGVARSAGFTYLSTDERANDDGVRYREMTWELRPSSAG